MNATTHFWKLVKILCLCGLWLIACSLRTEAQQPNNEELDEQTLAELRELLEDPELYGQMSAEDRKFFEELLGVEPGSTKPPEEARPEQAAAKPDETLTSEPAHTIPPTTPATQEATSIMPLPVTISADKFGPVVLAAVDPGQVFGLLEQLTGKSILQAKGMPRVQISVNIPKPISREEAINELLSALSLQDIAVLELNDNSMKAVATKGVNAQAPELIEGSTLAIKPSQAIRSKVFDLKYAQVDSLIKILQPFLSPSIGSLIPFASRNSFWVTDTVLNLQRMERVIEQIDIPIRLSDEIMFFKMKNVSAAEVQQQLQKLQDGPLKANLQGRVTFAANEANQLIVITHPGNAPLIEQLIGNLDIDVEPLTQSKTFRIQYAEATKVQELVQKMIDGQKAASDKRNANRTASAATNRRDEASANNRRRGNNRDTNSPTPPALAQDSLQFSDFVTVVADERSNSIVASGTPTDLKQVGRLINDIDVKLGQVRIEVVIAEVTLSDSQARGLDSFNFGWSGSRGWQLGFTGPTPDGGDNPSYTVLGAPPVANTNSTFSLEHLDLMTSINAAMIKNNVQTLSAPTIMTSHNKEAIVIVGEQFPVITQRSGSDESTAGRTTSSVTYKDIAIELKVTPLIGTDGVIQMTIEQKIDNKVDDIAIDGIQQPVIGHKEAKSFISVRDREIIILGGLQQSTDTYRKRKFPFLGDIPVLGNIFSSKTKELKRTELMIFIKPYLVTSDEESYVDAQDAIGKVVHGDDIKYFFENSKFKTGPLQQKESTFQNLMEYFK